MPRRAILICFLAFTVAPAGMLTAKAEDAIWLRVYLDRFDFDGKSYKSSSDLVSALKNRDRTRKVALNWVIPKTEPERTKMEARVEEARTAAKSAGIQSLPAVANEVF